LNPYAVAAPMINIAPPAATACTIRFITILLVMIAGLTGIS
jgi:hypothetical protein